MSGQFRTLAMFFKGTRGHEKSLAVLAIWPVLASWSHSPPPLHALSLYWATKTIFSHIREELHSVKCLTRPIPYIQTAHKCLICPKLTHSVKFDTLFLNTRWMTEFETMKMYPDQKTTIPPNSQLYQDSGTSKVNIFSTYVSEFQFDQLEMYQLGDLTSWKFISWKICSSRNLSA